MSRTPSYNTTTVCWFLGLVTVFLARPWLSVHPESLLLQLALSRTVALLHPRKVDWQSPARSTTWSRKVILATPFKMNTWTLLCSNSTLGIRE